ncbi:MAG: C40 family peptidase [Fimbriimonadaceae bacterium]|nr:C40 family peptidase [Fimbriimonadaceae bacterium]
MRLARPLVFIVFLLAALGAQAQKKITLGKLGQALEGASIHASPSSSARVYYKVRAYEYLIIQNAKQEQWLRVLLQNGKFGYISAEKVARLPYDVTQDQTRPTPNTTSRAGGSRESLAGYSLNFVGTKYVWGGNDINNGVDCSGFVKALYGKIGVSLPRTAAEQALVGEPIYRLEDLRPGDRLYFWSAKRNKIGHTGIYLGGGYFCHSSTSRGAVGTDSLTTPYYRKNLVAARR